MNRIKRFFLFFFVSLSLIFFDQWTKHLAVAFLKGGAEIALLPRVLYLLYVENPGAAFGILRGQQFFFLLITIVVLLGILYTVWKIPSSFHSGQAEMTDSSEPMLWTLSISVRSTFRSLMLRIFMFPYPLFSCSFYLCSTTRKRTFLL